MEVVMPPCDDVNAALEKILAPFDENGEENRHVFWDWWVIGGRWSGTKAKAKLDPAKIEAFYAELNERKVTVSGVQMGKQELSPASQIQEVDALWREMFPESGLQSCPLFGHSGDKLPGDICTLDECPKALKASRVIVAGNSHRDDLDAVYMISESEWNGVNHIDTGFSGLVSDAISAHIKRLKNYGAEYAERITPRPDWLVVTVDYHS